MGEKYKAELQDRINEIGADNLRVYINPEGVHPHYYQHLQETFLEAGVQMVDNRLEANFVFEGEIEPENQAGQMVAYFRNQELQFAGVL